MTPVSQPPREHVRLAADFLVAAVERGDLDLTAVQPALEHLHAALATEEVQQ